MQKKETADVHVRVSRSTRKRLKVEAAKYEISIPELIRRLLIAFV